MSDLIYKGNVVHNFGEFLPAPYIERIYVYEDRLEVKLSLLFNSEWSAATGTTPMDDDYGFKSYIEFLVAQHMFIYLVVGRGESLSGFHDARNVASIHEVIDGEKNIFEAFYGGWEEPAGSGIIHNFSFTRYAISDFKISDSTIEHDEEGKTFFKLNASLDFPGGSPNQWNPVPFYGDPAYPSRGAFYTLAFTSILPSNSDSIVFYHHEGASRAGSALMETIYTEGTSNLKMPLALIERSISNVAWEKVFENGVIANPVQVNYFDSDGAIYNEPPFLGLDGLYYKANSITHNSVFNSFNQFVKSYDNITDLDPLCENDLKSARKNISYTIETYKNDPTLLVKLNQFRLAFPKKSPVNQVGELYQNFKTLLGRTMGALALSPRLEKRLITNTKVIDMRHVGTFLDPSTLLPVAPDWAVPGLQVPSPLLYANDAFPISRISYRTRGYDVPMLPTLTLDGPPTDEVDGHTVLDIGSTHKEEQHVRNFGYLFFDYGKALTHLSYLSQIYSVRKIEDFFSRNITNKNFKCASFTLGRWIHAGKGTAVHPAILNSMNCHFPQRMATAPEGGLWSFQVTGDSPIPEKIIGKSTGFFVEETEIAIPRDCGYVVETGFGSDRTTGPTQMNYSYVLPRKF